MDRQIKTDVLVIGAGNAGLFAAIKAAEEGAAVTLVDKGFAMAFIIITLEEMEEENDAV